MTILALTGTPGTGKTTITRALGDAGWRTLHLGSVAEAAGLLTEEDPQRPGTHLVDVDAVLDHVQEDMDAARTRGFDLALEAHWAHDLPGPDAVCVLRASPSTLEERLRGRGWSPEKVLENVEAEALGVIAQEAREAPHAFEVDTTTRDVEGTVRHLLRVLNAPERRDPPGTVDWISREPGWFGPRDG